ncbi:MAG: histidine kinase [Marinilabiliales bacterium]|nr:MAG: histidine kinase [Marinilabiliales bacterium]
MPPMSKNFVFVFILVLLVTGVFSFFFIIQNNFATAQANKELQNKILDTQLQLKNQELQYLKMQIHPHFLFNTLNTIYGLSLKSSQQTPDVILKLSNLLDYILYQVNKPAVSLAEELDHIMDYMELERIRFKDTLKISTSVKQVDPDLMIAPMILIPFVENAFKHGKITDGFLHIEMKLSVNNGQMNFEISNTAGDPEESKNGGIGLQNIQKRLDMNYPENHLLNIRRLENRYIVNLSLSGLKNLNHEQQD